ncbi:Flp family type IVb pilin [Selenihalanaerobacter shriftii]|uniref:Pilus assembly protein Flp/PilA n=1 Tax=Selenihalanaerobacter shriftii TaxID=142842 RepID=A0A1T4KQU4_9FIRM|nr:Flp family type IVb pilin [Selenihalanaerobacter shriftii]SJZ44707.1 pilus assembly protein Flp/PilA [Selenihalanaerobacter shriftii]
MLGLLTRLFKEEEGQGMVEYGLILALIAVVVVGILTTMGDNLKGIFDTISSKLSGTTS